MRTRLIHDHQNPAAMSLLRGHCRLTHAKKPMTQYD